MALFSAELEMTTSTRYHCKTPRQAILPQLLFQYVVAPGLGGPIGPLSALDCAGPPQEKSVCIAPPLFVLTTRLGHASFFNCESKDYSMILTGM